MMSSDQEFEDEVRRIARLLWPSAEFDGAAIEDGRERDGIFETSEFVHVIECTVSRARDKARDDATKIAKLLRKLAIRHPTKFTKGWFVTLEEPTADQRTAVKDTVAKEKLQGAQIVAVSFDQFRSQLVDARSYLSQRRVYPFGSVRDPSTGRAVTELEYVPLQILNVTGRTYDTDQLTSSLIDGASYLLLGDYGAGKSATLREVYLGAAKRFWGNKTLTFPVLLNLRDHHGQSDPVEALERHGRKVGFANPSSLVRAWRGGFTVLLLDGFDEIAAAGWAGKTKSLKELRFRSMELVRAFVRESPRQTGMVIAGRTSFFDSDAEMKTALGFRAGTEELFLTEFNDEQVARFLNKSGWTSTVPEWLPSRPLLLAYLAARKLLTPDLVEETGADPASGWDSLLQRIAEREAELEVGIDPDTVRGLIERVAMLARNSVDGLGPVPADAIVAAFQRVCGYPPDDRGAVLLQRLPGLGAHHSEDGSRVFVDKDFVEAARGGALFRTIENPYGFDFDSDVWQSAVRPLAAQLCAYRCGTAGFGTGKVAAALRHLATDESRHTAAADMLLVVLELAGSLGQNAVFIREVLFPELRFEEAGADLRAAEIQDCVVGELEIDAAFPAETHLPRFVRCHFGTVAGRTGERDLPQERFEECGYDAFEEAARTTNAIMNLPLPLGTKVMLTVLRKLYAQGGSGRKESALFRGLDNRAQALVPSVLALLRRENLVAKSTRGAQSIWIPTRSPDARKRALSMLAAPNASTDRALTLSKSLEK
jgi:hypothetical protein